MCVRVFACMHVWSAVHKAVSAPPKESLPPAAEIKAAFAQVVASMEVSPQHEKDLMRLPDAKKWQLVLKDVRIHLCQSMLSYMSYASIA